MENGKLKIENKVSGGMRFRYRNEDEMKDSGVEWLGKIPNEWAVSKFKYFYTFGMGETILKENLSINGLPVYSATEENVIFGKYNNSKLVLKEGDIIIPARGNSIGAVKIVKDKCTCTQTTIYGKKIGNLNEKFIYYFMKGNRKQLFYFDQTAIPQITTNQVQENILAYGDSVIQNRISKFLDKKIAEFDSIISKKEALIQKLEEAKKSLISEVVTGKVKVVKSSDGYELVERKKEEMKDSGVEWLGEIPKEWEVKKLKYLFEIKKNIAGKLGYDVLSVTQSGIKIKDITKNEGQLSMDYSKYQLVDINDFIMNHMDLLTGFVDCSRFKGVTSPDYRVFKLKNTNNYKEYYNFIFQACYYNRIFYGLAQGVSGMGRWRLQTDKFLNFVIPLPVIAEQVIIAEVVAKKVEEFRKLKDRLEMNIEKLKEAKQSLISEVVTGKIEIL